MKYYQKTITVDKPVAIVYTALTEHIADWWTKEFRGSSAHAHDRFTVSFGKTQKTFIIVDAKPAQFVIWECVNAHIANPSLSNKAEWVGTRIYWTLNGKSQATTIEFRHEGLTPDLECYKLCEAGWDQFLASLSMYISTNSGQPYLAVA